MEDMINKMSTLDWIIFWLAIASFIPLIIVVIIKKGAGQNSTTWTLWFILDVIQFTVRILAHGSWVVLTAYMLGSGTIALILPKKKISFRKSIKDIFINLIIILKKKKISHLSFEFKISILVISCVIIWLSSSAYYGVIFATVAQVLAGIPLFLDNWKNPQVNALPSYIGFFTANVLTTFTAPEFTVPYVLFSGVFVLSGLLYVIPIVRKLRQDYIKI